MRNTLPKMFSCVEEEGEKEVREENGRDCVFWLVGSLMVSSLRELTRILPNLPLNG
jgi:hypothetical protein